MFMVDVAKFIKECSKPSVARTRYPDPYGEDEFEFDDFESDEFRMYSFKIKKCPINRAHDWTVCPYAHRGERARRRDPRRHPYVALACPDFKATGGICPRGELCEYAHGVFEYWLHPAKYRTRACNAGHFCTRPVCFFAHSTTELRYASAHHLPKWVRLALRAKAEAKAREETYNEPNSSGGRQGLGLIAPLNPESLDPGFDTSTNSEINVMASACTNLNLELLESLKRLGISDYLNKQVIMKNNNINYNNVDLDTPNLDWVSDLLAN